MLRSRRVFFGGVLLAVFLVQCTGAALLPTSSWEGGEKWQGSAFYSGNDDFLQFNVRVDYAVYKIKDDEGASILAGLSNAEQTLVDGFGTTDYTYIYAYQVLTRDDNAIPVSSFSLFDGEGEVMDEDFFGDRNAIDDDLDGENGIEPSDILGEGVWEFDGLTLKGGNNSWYLVYGSNSAPVVGGFDVTASEEVPLSGPPEQSAPIDPIDPAPEPMTILLLGSGFLAVRRRRKSVRI